MNDATFALILVLLIILVAVVISIDMKLGKLVLVAEEQDDAGTISINGNYNVVGNSNLVKSESHV